MFGNVPNNYPSSPRPYVTRALSPQYPQYPHKPNYTSNEVSRLVNAPIRQGQVVKGTSRINYVPYEKKVIQYQDQSRIQRVPKVRKIVDYQQRRVVEEIPRQVTVTDYYAVQNIIEYHKEIIPQKKVEMVPIEKKIKKIEYIPVEKQVVHYPEGHDHSKSRVILANQGIIVKNDAQFRKLDPKLIYNYSQDSGSRPIGYYEDGHHRYVSTAPGSPQFHPNSHTVYQQQPQFYQQSNVQPFLGSQRTTYVNSHEYIPQR